MTTEPQSPANTCPACGAVWPAGADACPACGTPADPLLGHVIAGKYRVVARIGEGAMGRVYRAEQIPLGKPFAVKVLSPRLLSDEDSRARFAREAHAAANLNHPNCVSVVDYGQEEKAPAYIVMEFIEGRTLEDLIVREGPLDRARVVDLTLQILDALTEAHGLGILHRDLKPENILVTRLRTHGELLKVVDFGIAQLMDTDESQRLTRQSVVCGTPEYMSPEQARGLPLDPRSDLYAVGCILYQMLTGRPPFERASAIEVLQCHLSEAPVPPSRLLGTPPDPLEAVCLRALAKDPNDRYADALEFRRAVQEAARQAPATRPCPGCRAPVDVGARFCSACGTELTAPGPSGQARKRPTRRSGLNLARGTAESSTEVLRRAYPLPLVDRKEDLERLTGLIEDAAAGVRGLVLTGPTGVGKTRLADEAAGVAEAAGYRVFYVGRDPSLADAPLWPIRTMVGQVLGIDPATCSTVDLGRAANLLGVAVEALPGLAELFGLEGPAASLEHRVRKRECQASVLQALTAGGGQRVLLVFDDVDRYDEASRLLLRRLVAHETTSAVRLLYVSSEADAGWFGLPVHTVGGLPREAVRRALVTEQTPASIAALIDRATEEAAEVLPLRFDLRLRLLLEGAAPEALDGSLEELAAARLDALDGADVRTVVDCAAVLGERCSDAALLAMAPGLDGLDRGRVADVLARLHTENLLLVTRAGERAFAHPVLWQAAYGRIPPNRRAALHQRALVLCDLSGRFDATTRARHATLARHPQAAAALADAAAFAEASFDDGSAADLAMAALRALPPPPQGDPELRSRLVAGLGRYRLDGARRARADRLLEREAELAEGEAASVVAVARGRVAMAEGRHEAAVEHFGRALGPLIAAGALDRVLEVYRFLALAYVRAGRWRKAIEELEEGLDLCTLGEGPRAATDLSLWRYLLAVAEAHRVAGQLAGAQTWAEHALAQAERKDDGLGLLRAHALLAWLLRERGLAVRARVHVVRALSQARHFGDRLSTAELLLERAELAAAEGDRDTQVRSLAEAARLSQLLGWRAGAAHARKALAALGASPQAE